jgi:hypothetical protein
MDYHPSGNSWRRLPDPPRPGALLRSGAVATGHLYVWGEGTPAPGAAFNLTSDTWAAAPAVPEAVVAGEVHPALATTANLVLLVGAELHDARWRIARYDPATGQWTSDPGPAVPARQAAGVTAGAGLLFIWGGFDGASGPGRLRSDGAMLPVVSDPGALACEGLKAGGRITANDLHRGCVRAFDCADGRIQVEADVGGEKALEGFAPIDQHGQARADTTDAVWQERGPEYQRTGRTKLQFDCGG